MLTITRHDLPRASAYDQAGDLVGEATYVLIQTVQMTKVRLTWHVATRNCWMKESPECRSLVIGAPTP